jgi:hypothetical protein
VFSSRHREVSRGVLSAQAVIGRDCWNSPQAPRQARRPPDDLTGLFRQRDRNAIFTVLPAQGVDGALYRHRAKEHAVIMHWDGRGLAIERKNAYSCVMRIRGSEVESSCNDMWDRVKPGER